MAELPRMHLARAPLVVCAASLASGILIGHFFNADSSQFRIVIAVGLALLLLLAIIFVRRQRHGAGTLLVVATFLLSGISLSVNDYQRPDPSRIKRMFDDNALAVNEPVEMTAVIKGPVQSAPDGLYLVVRTESLRVRGSERAAAGDVLLLAHVASPEVRNEYQRLELRHGARLRVMTTLDRDEDYRNPGVLPFTEYLDRKGYDATGVIKSPLLVERLDDAPVFLPLAWLYEWREQLEAQFDQRFSPETAGVLDAVLLGNRYKILTIRGGSFSRRRNISRAGDCGTAHQLHRGHCVPVDAANHAQSVRPILLRGHLPLCVFDYGWRAGAGAARGAAYLALAFSRRSSGGEQTR